LLNLLKKYTRTFLIGKPSQLFFEGWKAWLEGNEKIAFKAWQASAESAKQLAMPWDEAIALREIGKRMKNDSSREYLQRAQELFTASNALKDANETQALLDQLSD
jgi:hypothetical protein